MIFCKKILFFATALLLFACAATNGFALSNTAGNVDEFHYRAPAIRLQQAKSSAPKLFLEKRISTTKIRAKAALEHTIWLPISSISLSLSIFFKAYCFHIPVLYQKRLVFFIRFRGPPEMC